MRSSVNPKAAQGGASADRVPESITDTTTGRRIHLLDWQAMNRRASWFLAGFMILLLGGIGYLAALALDPAAAWLFIGIAAAVAVLQSLAAYWFSDRMALAATGARRATREEQRYLVNVTEAVSLGAGVPPPRVFVIDDPAPNAFATGRDPQHAAIAVTTGLLERLDRQELEGVVAHELAHVRNYDVRFASMLAATVGALVILRDVMLRVLFYGRRGSGRGGGQAKAIALVLLIVLVVLAPILATLLRLAVSRRREYLADATAAYITRNPEGLASALEQLAAFDGKPVAANEGVRHMFFVNPVARLNGSGLWSTHPPIADRIDRLRRM